MHQLFGARIAKKEKADSFSSRPFVFCSLVLYRSSVIGVKFRPNASATA